MVKCNKHFPKQFAECRMQYRTISKLNSFYVSEFSIFYDSWFMVHDQLFFTNLQCCWAVVERSASLNYGYWQLSLCYHVSLVYFSLQNAGIQNTKAPQVSVVFRITAETSLFFRQSFSMPKEPWKYKYKVNVIYTDRLFWNSNHIFVV